MKTKKKGSNNREAWLRTAYKIMRKEFLSEAPEECAIGWGFPSRRAAITHKGGVVGQCWENSKVEGNAVILISPTNKTPLNLVETMLHEMIHAATPGAGHRKAFSQLAKRVGFTKPWTKTPGTPELKVKLTAILKRLPEWPGGVLNPKGRQVTRQLKAVCDCGRILRMAATTLDKGPILCGLCKTEFTRAD